VSKAFELRFHRHGQVVAGFCLEEGERHAHTAQLLLSVSEESFATETASLYRGHGVG
jgi:hypothetical protein